LHELGSKLARCADFRGRRATARR